MIENVYILALFSNISFALGSQVFTHYSRKISSIWTNAFKALVALICFAIVLIFKGQLYSINQTSTLIFLFSGFIGLGMGDIFLLYGFSKIGPGRTMVLFSFQPVIIGIISYFIFGQLPDSSKIYAIIFFIICVFIFSFESFKQKGNWEINGILAAFFGMIIDAVGILLTRYAFDIESSITPWQANFYRALGAVCFFILFSRFKPLHFFNIFFKLKTHSRLIVIIGAILGTFLSLSCYLMAIQKANLATLTALSITSTIFASLFECIIEKKMPSKYLGLSFIFFLLGMNILFDFTQLLELLN